MSTASQNPRGSWTIVTRRTPSEPGRVARAIGYEDARMANPRGQWSETTIVAHFKSDRIQSNMQTKSNNAAMSNFALEQRVYQGKTFEFFKDPPTILSARDEAICLPYGIEVEGRFTARPHFAGGTDTRNHLSVQIAVGSETAAVIRRAEEAFAAMTSLSGEWAPSVVEKNGRCLFKARLIVSASPNLSRFRYGVEGPLCSGWPALEDFLLHDLRPAMGKIALMPTNLWKVQGQVECTWRILQLDVEPCTHEVKDLFADAY